MQVMDAYPDWVGDLEVRLGHRALLEAALVNARVPKARPLSLCLSHYHRQLQQVV